MAIILIKHRDGSHFDKDFYEIDTNRKPDSKYEQGDIICDINPFFDIPLKLEIAIRRDGTIIFRKWYWNMSFNGYLHFIGNDIDGKPTPEQIDTVNGLFSKRIKFEGLSLIPGASLQDICPINIAEEERKIGEKIYLA